MDNIINRFEVIILRPLQIFFVCVAIISLFNGAWLLLLGCVIGLFYLGIIGSNLHPLQSVSDLSKGPLEGAAAISESKMLPPEIKQLLVGQACTRAGITVGCATGMILWIALGWQWYYAFIALWATMIIVGGLLKFVFKAV